MVPCNFPSSSAFELCYPVHFTVCISLCWSSVPVVVYWPFLCCNFFIKTREETKKLSELEMWANAQRDGRPAEYRWCPLFNAAKFGWRPLLECRAVTMPRRETSWNYLGCPKLTKRSELLVGRSSPYCKDVWGRYRCLTSFFRSSIRALIAKI